MKSESCLALHVSTNPNYEGKKQTNKPLNLGPELETSSMSFVVAGISWIGSKSTRNKGKRTKGATALHWDRGEAPLGECWVPAPINQMQGCMPVIHLVLKGKWKCHPGLFPIFMCLPDTLASTGNSVWASSGLIVYQNHALNLNPSYKPCLLGSVVCPPCSHSHLSTARASLPAHGSLPAQNILSP